jgi:hypothetical protein
MTVKYVKKEKTEVTVTIKEIIEILKHVESLKRQLQKLLKQ